MDQTLQVDLTWLNLIVGAIIPVLTGALVKAKASSQFKAYVNLALSAVGGALVVVVGNQGELVPKEFVAGILTTLVTSWGSYAGFYKKTGITDAVQGATGDFGLGTAVPAVESTPFSEDEIRVIVQQVIDANKRPRKAAAKVAAKEEDK